MSDPNWMPYGDSCDEIAALKAIVAALETGKEMGEKVWIEKSDWEKTLEEIHRLRAELAKMEERLKHQSREYISLVDRSRIEGEKDAATIMNLNAEIERLRTYGARGDEAVRILQGMVETPRAELAKRDEVHTISNTDTTWRPYGTACEEIAELKTKVASLETELADLKARRCEECNHWKRYAMLERGWCMADECQATVTWENCCCIHWQPRT